MNKYDKVFEPQMSSKQVTTLYFRLCDEVKGDEEARRELYEAHMRAWETATKREREKFDKALEEGYILCAN